MAINFHVQIKPRLILPNAKEIKLTSATEPKLNNHDGVLSNNYKTHTLRVP